MVDSKAEKLLEEFKERIRWADDMFKNSPELVEVYKSIIKDRVVEVDGMKWPIDSLVATTINEMKVFYAQNIAGWWPPDSAVVVVASNEKEASTLLEQELEKEGVPLINPGTGHPYVLRQIDVSKPSVVVLDN